MSNGYFHNPNDMGKNHMKGHIGGDIKEKKMTREAVGPSTSSKAQKLNGEVARRPVKERIFSSLTSVKVDAKNCDLKMITNNLSMSA